MFFRAWTEPDEAMWRPWDDFFRFTRVLDPTFEATWQAGWDNPAPRLSVWSNDDAVVVTAQAPGLEAQSLDVAVVDNTLIIRGERKPLELGDGDTYHRRERSYGAFERSLELPYAIDADKVQATYSHGILAVHLPRSEADKPRKIQVTAG